MSLRQAPRELCVQCHAPAGLAAKHRGFPVAAADCAGCHAPHAAQKPNLPHEQVHAPFGKGDCASCHAGTSVSTKQPQPALCFTCHVGMAEDLKLGTLHAPLTGAKACTVCHAAHTAPVASLLPRRQVAVCGTCHQAQADLTRTAAHRHPKVDERDCTVCHDPHLSAVGTVAAGADSAQTGPSQVCLDCHTYRDHTDHPMGADSLDPRTGARMICTSCHDPHGSAFVRFLNEDPQGKLCVGCHTDKLRQKRN
jgi:predicted CXXCH cytochrome family protein